MIVTCRMGGIRCWSIFVHNFWALDISDRVGIKWVNIKSCIYSQKIIKHKIRIVYNNMSGEKTFKFSLIIYGQYLKIEFILSLQVLSALSHLSCLQESRGYGGRTEICPQPFPEQWRQARIIVTIWIWAGEIFPQFPHLSPWKTSRLKGLCPWKLPRRRISPWNCPCRRRRGLLSLIHIWRCRRA